MEEHELKGVLSLDPILPAGNDSNFGRLLSATAERVFGTQYLRRVFIAHHPMGTGVVYPNGAIFPGDPPESEYSNITNQIIYTCEVILSTIGSADPYIALFQLLNIREAVLDVCRSKAKIDLMPGDLHEDTTIRSPALILPEVEEGMLMFSTGFFVDYLVTEPRKEE